MRKLRTLFHRSEDGRQSDDGDSDHGPKKKKPAFQFRLSSRDTKAGRSGNVVNQSERVPTKQEASVDSSGADGIKDLESTDHDTDSKDIATQAPNENDMSRKLWVDAYTKLQEDEGTRELVKDYETILDQQLEGTTVQTNAGAANEFASCANVDQKIPRMRLVVENTLTLSSKHAEIKESISKAAGFIGEINLIIKPMLGSNPVAAMAWSGICAALPLLIRPITAGTAMVEGLKYVMGRMKWYMSLVQSLLDERHFAGVEHGRSELRDGLTSRITELYMSILTYEMQSVCYCYRDRAIVKALRAIVALDDWESRLESLQSLESKVQEDMKAFASAETLASLDEIAKSTKQLDTISNSLQEFIESQERTRKEQQARELEARRVVGSKLVGKFRTTDYDSQMKLNPERVPGTCEWFCSHKNFHEWLDPEMDSDLLLVSADPGCGKSTLARYLVEEVLPMHCHDTPILYFFFKDTPEQRRLQNGLCAMLHQLFCKDDSLAEDLKAEINKAGANITSDTSMLWNLFTKACMKVPAQRSPSLVCVFDALDECDGKDIFILVQQLRDFISSSDKAQPRPKVKFLATTRGYPEILEQFHGFRSEMIHLSGDGKQEKDQINGEINLVLQYKLEKLAEKKHFLPKRQERLRAVLQAQGSEQRTYLWLKLVFELLESKFKTTDSEWEKLVKNTPATVNQAYEALLAKVEEDEKEAVRLMLHLLVAAYRPLTLYEMNMAMHVRDHLGAPDERSLELSSDDEFKQWLLQTCGFFVTVYDGSVYFIHQTAKEFLVNSGSDRSRDRSEDSWYHAITDQDAHRLFAESCIAYLSLRQFRQEPFHSLMHPDSRPFICCPSQLFLYGTHQELEFLYRLYEDYKFLEYVADSWHQHLLECRGADIKIINLGDGFESHYFDLFTPDLSGAAPAWLILALCYYWEKMPNPDWVTQRNLLENYNPTNIAALFCEPWLMQHALNQGLAQRAKNQPGGSVQNACGITALHLSAYNGHVEGLRLLLASDQGFDVDMPDAPRGITPIHFAAVNLHLPAMHFLLDHDAKVCDYRECRDLCSPLGYVVAGYAQASPPERPKYLKMLRRLITKGSDVNGLIYLGSGYLITRTPLSCAAGTETPLPELDDMLDMLASSLPAKETDLDIEAKYLALSQVDLLSQPAFLRAYDESLVKVLVDNGANVDLVNAKYGRTALEFVIIDMNRDLKYSGIISRDRLWNVAFLLHAGADPKMHMEPSPQTEGEDPTYYGAPKPALDLAIIAGNTAVVALLLNYGSIPNDIDEEETRILERRLHLAASSHSTAQIVALLVHHKHNLNIDTIDERGRTPLHNACKVDFHPKRDLNCAGYLVKHGANVHSLDQLSNTPLHYACASGLPEIAKSLLQHDADAEAKNLEGQTPLHAATSTAILTLDSLGDPLARLADLVQMLCDHGASIDPRDKDGNTPLHLATGLNSRETIYVVEALLDLHADPNALNDGLLTPLHMACKRVNPEVTKLLLQFDADAEIPCVLEDGKRALHFLLQNFNWGLSRVASACLLVLISHGADPNGRDDRGQTPLRYIYYTADYIYHHLWRSQAEDEYLKVFLKYGANPNARDALGKTPFRRAMEYWIDAPKGFDTKNIQETHLVLLVKAGADVDAKDDRGYTALHYACYLEHLAAVEFLLEHGAHKDARDAVPENGMTPLHWACISLATPCIEALLRHGADIDARDVNGCPPMQCIANLNMNLAIEETTEQCEANKEGDTLHQQEEDNIKVEEENTEKENVEDDESSSLPVWEDHYNIEQTDVEPDDGEEDPDEEMACMWDDAYATSSEEMGEESDGDLEWQSDGEAGEGEDEIGPDPEEKACYIARLLLDAGAWRYARAVNKSGKTALQYAQDRGWEHLAGLLQEAALPDCRRQFLPADGRMRSV